jgi:UDP-3-O-[3-hydroxymyristoyl] N-acetylglucosamine deacetylase
MNNKLIRALLAEQDAFEVISFRDERQAPEGFGLPARAW